MRLFLCLKGSDKFEQEVFEALYGNQSRRDSTNLYLSGGQSGYSVRDQNSKLQIQVNKSSVEAVDEAQKKQKEADQMAWVRAANQHKVIVEEIILKELIYV